MSTQGAKGENPGAQNPGEQSAGEQSAKRQRAKRQVKELEGYRAMAALSTVVYHVWQEYTYYDAEGTHPPVENRFLEALIGLDMIDLFFVLSAFLLTTSYARAAIDVTSVRPARHFLFRRAVRVLPLYVLAILVVWSYRNPDLPGNWLDLFEHLTFTQVFDRQRIFYTIGPTWSMALEIMFYFLLVIVGPLAIRVCRRIPSRSRRIAVCAGGCLALYLVPWVWITLFRYGLDVPYTEWWVYFSPGARFGGFAAGMGLAVLRIAIGDRGQLGPRAATTLAAAVVVTLYCMSMAAKTGNTVDAYYHPVAALLWPLLLMATIHTTGPVWWHRLVRARWLTAIGITSYSLYLWHEPIMIQLNHMGLLPSTQDGFLLALLLELTLALSVAALSYWIIEYPSSMLGRLRDSSGRSREFYPAREEGRGAATAAPRAMPATEPATAPHAAAHATANSTPRAMP